MISILCSNYNSTKWIDRYLSYVNDQTLTEIEVIFVDANSTDDSVQKIKDYKFRKGISKKLFECKQRIGIYAAWNLAIENSSHDYVINYNTDDKLFPKALSTLYGLAVENPEVSVVYSNCYISDEVTHTNLVGHYDWNDSNDLNSLLIKGCSCGPFPMLKKQSIIEVEMFDPTFTISGDYEMWCRLCSKGYKFLKTKDHLGVFYHNPDGMSTAGDSKRREEHVKQDTLIRSMYGKEG